MFYREKLVSLHALDYHIYTANFMYVSSYVIVNWLVHTYYIHKYICYIKQFIANIQLLNSGIGDQLSN